MSAETCGSFSHLLRGWRSLNPLGATLSFSTRLVLVRHGASRSTELQIVAGHSGCRGLSVDGVFQSELLSRWWLKNPPYDQQFPYGAAYSSVMRRSYETGLIVMSQLGLGLDGSNCELCEIHPGVTDGLSWKEVSERYDGFDVLANPNSPIAPGGESWRQMRERVTRHLLRLARKHRGRTVLIFTHRGVIDATLEEWLHGSTTGLMQSAENTALTTWTLEVSDRGKTNFVLNSHNDISHLEQA